MNKGPYNPGEWVLSGKDLSRGYVVKSDSIDTEVVLTSKGDGTQIPVEFITLHGEKVPVTKLIRNYHLTLSPELPKLYSYNEINLALMTKDKAWYEDITSLRDRQEDEA